LASSPRCRSFSSVLTVSRSILSAFRLFFFRSAEGGEVVGVLLLAGEGQASAMDLSVERTASGRKYKVRHMSQADFDRMELDLTEVEMSRLICTPPSPMLTISSSPFRPRLLNFPFPMR
jgi:hypothetical protein